MSLLDDVSIVVTPNGYKAGELYAVIPVPTEGAELVTNGDFATDSDWSKATGVTISGGNAIFNNSTANNNGIYQAAVFQANTQYKITAEVSNYSSGNVTAWSGSSQNSTSNESFTSNGTKTWIISTGASNGYFLLSSATTNGNFNIDNISVKEYTSADMDVTRATAATRVDENGLVNYAEVIGGEEVTDGDFPSGTTAWSFGGGWSLGVGVAEADGSTSTSNLLTQDLGLVATKTYTISFSSNRVGGTLFVKNGTSYTSSTIYTLNTGTGLEVQTFTVTSPSNSAIGFYAYSYEGTIDDVTVKEVTRDNVPRIDYTGGGCPHILAEPQRTNLFPYSENASTWSNSLWTTTDDYAISPDGTQNAFRGVSTSNASLLYISGLGSAGENTISIYAKSNTGSDQKFRFFGNGNTTQSTDKTATQEWQRFEYTETFSTVTWGLRGASVSETNDILFYGMQHEVGSYPTSLIPTSGSTVTRNQDIFTRDGIGSLINSTEGVLFLEMASFGTGSATQYISITNGASSSYGLRILYHTNGSVYFQKYVNGTRTTNLATSSITITDFNKLAIRYNSTTVDVWANGVEILTNADTNVIPSGTLNRLGLDIADELNPFYGKVKQLQVYDTALTDEQLLQLTGESGTDFYESYAEMASALTYTIQ